MAEIRSHEAERIASGKDEPGQDSTETSAGLAINRSDGTGARGETLRSMSAEPALRSLMIEHAVIIHGAVRQPGSYPVDGQVRLEMFWRRQEA